MKVIFNGDDLGFSPGCNYAILDCFHHGLLTSASLMINMDFAGQAWEMVKEEPGLSLGIHINLTAGKPLTDYPFVDENGCFKKEILYNHEHSLKEAIEKEMQAQMDAYIKLTGRLPDHINSHHGLEQNPFSEQFLSRLSRDYGIPLRGHIYDGLYQIEDIDYITPAFMLSKAGKTAAEDVIAFLESLDEETTAEIAAHPGYAESCLMKLSGLNTARLFDADLFCDPVLKDYIEKKGIELCTYSSVEKREKYAD